VRCHTARHGAEKKARRHRRQLNDRLALQPEGVGEAYDEVDRHEDDEILARHKPRRRQGATDEPRSYRHGETRGDGAPGDRPMALDGMVSIGPGVGDVVDQIDT